MRTRSAQQPAGAMAVSWRAASPMASPMVRLGFPTNSMYSKNSAYRTSTKSKPPSSGTTSTATTSAPASSTSPLRRTASHTSMNSATITNSSARWVKKSNCSTVQQCAARSTPLPTRVACGAKIARPLSTQPDLCGVSRPQPSHLASPFTKTPKRSLSTKTAWVSLCAPRSAQCALAKLHLQQTRSSHCSND